MGGVWYLYGTCFTAPHVAPRPLYKGNAEDDVRSRPFFACHRRKTCMPQEPSSLGTNIRFALGKPHVPTVGEPIFLATRGSLPCHKRHSCVRVTRISQRAWHRVPSFETKGWHFTPLNPYRNDSKMPCLSLKEVPSSASSDAF